MLVFRYQQRGIARAMPSSGDYQEALEMNHQASALRREHVKRPRAPQRHRRRQRNLNMLVSNYSLTA